MINTLLFLSILIVLICIDYSVCQQSEDKAVFLLYKKRDQLALYAMKNPQLQQEKKYKYLKMVINRQIMLLKYQVPIVSIISAYESVTDEDKKAVNDLLKEIEQDRELKEIYHSCDTIFSNRLKKNTWIFNYLILTPTMSVLTYVINHLNNRNIRKKKVKERKRQYYQCVNILEEIPNCFRVYAKY